MVAVMRGVDETGKGRVAQLWSDQAWLWARGYQGGGPQAELLRRVAHWLMKEPDLEEEALRDEKRRRAMCERAYALGHHFAADAVAGDHCDLVGGHWREYS